MITRKNKNKDKNVRSSHILREGHLQKHTM